MPEVAIVPELGLIADAATGAAAIAGGIEIGATAGIGVGGLIASGVEALVSPAGLFRAATGIALNLALGQLTSRPSASSQQQATAQGALVNSVSNIEPIPVIYGRRLVGGSRIITEVTGPTRGLLQIIMVWCEGPVSSITQIYLNGVAISDARFAGIVEYENFLGTDTQAASGRAIAAIGDSAKWNESCTLSGVAYTWLQLSFDRTAFPTGLPTITADISGAAAVYDPRSLVTGYSNNPALCIRDYLSNTRYGRSIATAMIDDDAFSVAADHCDALVSTPAGDQARYTCDGIVNPDDAPLDTLRALLTSCRGFLVFSGGQYKLHCDKAESASSFALTEDNILGAWSFAMSSKRNRFNRIKATFFDPDQSWQPNLAVQESAVFRTADNELLLEAQLELPFTANAYRAAQIAQIEMKQSRFGIVASLTATIAATQLEVGDVVPVTHSTPGWSAKNFRVVEIELLNSDEVRLTLREYDDSVYTLDTLDTINAAPSTNLPDPAVVAAPGTPSVVESLYQTTGSAGVKSKAALSWGAAADLFVVNGGSYQAEYRASGASSWKIAGLVNSSVTSVDIFDLAPGIYEFRVKAFNSLGAASSYSPTTTKELFGLTAPPSDLANFAVQAYAGQAKLTWQKPAADTDLDVLIGGRILVRWSPRTSGASWDYGSLVNPDGYPGDTSIGFGPLMTGTYMAKAMDSSGNVSAAEATFVVTEALLTGLSTLSTVTESPAFTGSKSNVAAVDGGIQLDSVTLIDDMVTLMDDWGSIDSIGGIQATGSYGFASKMDLGSVKNARLFTSLDSIAFSSDDLIDSRVDLIDSWGLMDGVTIEDVEVQLMVRATNDDPASGGATWGPWHALGLVADYSARGFDFRLDFASGSTTHNRSVTTLAVAAKQ